MTNQTIAIKGESLTKKYGEFVAVDGLDLDVRTGEIFGFLGPNGAGKTTSIKTVKLSKVQKEALIELIAQLKRLFISEKSYMAIENAFCLLLVE